MTKKEYFDGLAREIRNDWFEDHKATLLVSGDGTKVIDWQKPGTWIYGMRFVIHSRWLAVLGDLGEATYEWSSNIDPEFLATLNFDYFLGKCRASEHGREFTVYEPDVLTTELAEYVKEADNEDRLRLTELLANLGVYCDRDEWVQAIREAYDDGLLRDAEEAGIVASLGLVPDGHAIAHWVGIRMACQQLLEAK